DADRARIGRQEACEQEQEGRLARPVGADERGDAAWRGDQVDVGHGVDRPERTPHALRTDTAVWCHAGTLARGADTDVRPRDDSSTVGPWPPRPSRPGCGPSSPHRTRCTATDWAACSAGASSSSRTWAAPADPRTR